MKNLCPLFRLFVFIICFGLVWPMESDALAMTTKRRAKAGAQKKGGAKKRGATARRGRSRGGRSSRRGGATAGAPRPAFDKIMSENRALLSESGDAEAAASQIEENNLR